MTTPAFPPAPGNIAALPFAPRKSVAPVMVSVGMAGVVASLVALAALSLAPPPAPPPVAPAPVPKIKGKGGKPPAPVAPPPAAPPNNLPMKAGAGLLGLGSLVLLGFGTRRSVSDAGRTGREWESIARKAEATRAQTDAQYAGLQSHLIEREAELTETKTVLEKQLRQMQRTVAKASRLESAVESTNDVIMLYEAPLQPGQPMRLIYVNPAFERMTGYSRDELGANSPKMLQGIMTDPETVAYLQEKLHLFQPVRAELINYRKDGSQFWVELNIQPIYDANGLPGGWMSVQRDISEQKSVAERMAYQATHDALTGLPNRTMFDKRLAEAVNAAKKTEGLVGIIFFDVDRFKQINDTLGHPIGDRLLQQVASRLTSRVHRHDTVARMGGDEFTILMPNLPSIEVAAETAQSLLEAMDEAFEIDGQELFVTGSIGVSLAPRDGTDAATLLKNADTAMYRAKEEGRDAFRIYTPSMNARAKDRLELETQLRRALDKNELYLQYQPQVDLHTGKIYGVEALIRWESPTLGRISPAQFIPLAEETGLIIPIGDFVLREAAAQAARWFESGTPLRVSVNLSGRQFEQPWIVDLIAEVLKEVNLPPEYFDIEMTEGILVKGDNVKNRLNDLKALGVRLSIDDFGTGYSSLSYLRTFPLDVLKIDRSFITPMTEEVKGEAMVRALVELGHACSMEVIAEGVETDAQRDALCALGCDAMQGFLMSPPVSARDVDLLIRKTAAAACPPSQSAKTQLRLVS